MNKEKQYTVLITGAGRGIGKAIADAYTAHNYSVLTPDRSELDLSSPNKIQSYLEEVSPTVDVLINNAGENVVQSLNSVTLDAWERVMNVNLTGPMLLIQHVAKSMCANRWGRIVNVSSCYSLVSRSGRGPYSSSKSGVSGLTRTAAIEYAPFNVLVNAVCPGFVSTDMTRKNNTPEQIAELCKQVPLGRLATPEEIAAYVYFLGSAQNTYITGQIAVIDGGFLCQ